MHVRNLKISLVLAVASVLMFSVAVGFLASGFDLVVRPLGDPDKLPSVIIRPLGDPDKLPSVIIRPLGDPDKWPSVIEPLRILN